MAVPDPPVEVRQQPAGMSSTQVSGVGAGVDGGPATVGLPVALTGADVVATTGACVAATGEDVVATTGRSEARRVGTEGSTTGASAHRKSVVSRT